MVIPGTNQLIGTGTMWCDDHSLVSFSLVFMDTSFSTNSVFDKINNLSTQVIAIFTAFMQHTKYFFINNTETTDAIIDVPGNIYLLSNTNTVILNNNLCIIYGNILPSNIDDYAIGSLFI